MNFEAIGFNSLSDVMNYLKVNLNEPAFTKNEEANHQCACDHSNCRKDAAVDYCKKDIEATKDMFDATIDRNGITDTRYGRSKEEICNLCIEKIIFSNPATIIVWADHTKTIVKCSPKDTYDKEKGIALCFMKKILGNSSRYNLVFKDYIHDEEEERK